MERTILGLSFSSRMLGRAVFKSNTIIDYSLKLNKDTWSPQKLDLIRTSLASYVSQHAITDIALTIPDTHHQTSDFKELEQAIEGLAHHHGLHVAKYSAKELYDRFGSPLRRTRKALVKRWVLFYPELSVYYERELTNKNKYYIKLFEAIAVAAFHSEEKK